MVGSKFFWTQAPNRASAVFGDQGKAQARVKLGTAFGQPEYWRTLTVSELEAVFELLDEHEQLQRFDEWHRNAWLCAVIANPYRNIEEHPEPFMPHEFMPESLRKLAGDVEPEPAPKPTWQELKQKVVHLNTLLGGTDSREGR